MWFVDKERGYAIDLKQVRLVWANGPNLVFCFNDGTEFVITYQGDKEREALHEIESILRAEDLLQDN